MAGVTLIELVMTLAISAILLTIAVPSFQSIVAMNRVSGITNELTASLQLARSEAIKRGRSVSVCKSSDLDAAITATAPACATATTTTWPDGWLVFVDVNGDGIRNGDDDTLIKVGRLLGNQPIATGADFAKFIGFNNNGTLNATGNEAARSLTVCIAPEQRQIIVDRVGQIRINSGTCP